MRILHSGCCEPLKAGVHGALGALAAACLGYNAAAFLVRRESHLGRNVLFYSLVLAVEVAHVCHHRSVPSGGSSSTRTLRSPSHSQTASKINTAPHAH